METRGSRFGMRNAGGRELVGDASRRERLNSGGKEILYQDFPEKKKQGRYKWGLKVLAYNVRYS